MKDELMISKKMSWISRIFVCFLLSVIFLIFFMGSPPVHSWPHRGCCTQWMGKIHTVNVHTFKSWFHQLISFAKSHVTWYSNKVLRFDVLMIARMWIYWNKSATYRGTWLLLRLLLQMWAVLRTGISSNQVEYWNLETFWGIKPQIEWSKISNSKSEGSLNQSRCTKWYSKRMINLVDVGQCFTLTNTRIYGFALWWVVYTEYCVKTGLADESSRSSHWMSGSSGIYINRHISLLSLFVHNLRATLHIWRLCKLSPIDKNVQDCSREKWIHACTCIVITWRHFDLFAAIVIASCNHANIDSNRCTFAGTET